jgi:hypothetical protein
MTERRKRDDEQSATPKKSSGSRNASKKAYAAKGPMQLARNRAAADRRVARRRTYWESPAGQARKFAKMNTPEKLEKHNLWVLARDARRIARKNDKQAA